MGNIAMKETESAEINDLLEAAIGQGQTYQEYRDMVGSLAAEGKTTGPEQSASYVEYTQLNNRRMNRWDKTLKLAPETVEKIKAVDRKLQFVVLTESWCGDAAPSLPVMHKISELNPNITMTVVLRDENPELIDQFLTNGAKSIPKLIVLDEASQDVLGDWGPRPKPATKLVQDYKAEHGKLTAEFRQDLQLWYNKDKGQSILSELIALF